MSAIRVLTAAAMRSAEASAAAREGVPLAALMEWAGAAVAEAALAMAGPGGRVLVLCGTGNNGGDGYVAARLLREAGADVTVAADASPRAGDARAAASAWGGPVVPLRDAVPGAGTLVVDALFGIGLARDLAGPYAAAIERVNRAGCRVLAVDVPSGLDADTGAVRGVALRADRTLTFGALKPGHLLLPGRALCGRVDIDAIGIEDGDMPGPTVFENTPDLWRSAFPVPADEGHKYARGHALVLSGGPSQTGAARLAARGALRAGAGLVTLVTSARALSVNAAHLTAIMLKVCDEPDELSDLLTDERYNAVALGPGLGIGDATRAWVGATLEANRATVLDADALTSFSGRTGDLAAMLAGRENAAVLTPHQGEFKRLLAGRDESMAEARAIVERASKLERTRDAARLLGAVVVLKGADTVIAAPDGRAAINRNGSPYLATAGSGDVLAGFVTGLLAQGMPGFEAACAAVWLHGEAGRGSGPGLIAEDLPEQLPAVLRDLLGASSEKASSPPSSC